MNPHMKEVIAALIEQRDAINRALEALEAVKNFTAAGRPSPAAAPSEFSCSEHPENTTEFSKKGVCKLCQSERMKVYWSDRRKPAPKPARRIELVYSKKQRCPKCGLTTRFERPRVASQDDFWTCQGTGCTLKIANYKIPVDREPQLEEVAL